jgi:hypothetical protein
MHKLLIIYPHWYPSNLAGVHRARLTGNYLSEFGWKPLVLGVKPEYYEETSDPDMHRLFSKAFQEYRVDAWKARKPRLVGDIGLRGFFQLYKKAKEIIREENPDFLWIPIPSFYTALLGRFLHEKTGIRYGIDYIDPWVRDISKDGSIRAYFSLWVAKILEPIAVKKASLITGVAYEYYKPVLERNFRIQRREDSKIQRFKDFKIQGFQDSKIQGFQDSGGKGEEPGSRIQEGSDPQLAVGSKQKAEDSMQGEHPNPLGTELLNPGILEFWNHKSRVIHVAFPYGFDPHDHEIEIPGLALPWDDQPGCKPIVYAGAFMPNSQVFLDVFLKAFAELDRAGEVPEHVHLYFLGTGMYPHKRVTAYAADHGLEHRVTEIRDRFPFLHILNFLAKADKLLIIGSTEKHYTASKTYQVILSKRPFLGMFHHESTAVEILRKTHTDDFLIQFQSQEKDDQFFKDTVKTVKRFLVETDHWNPDLSALEPYSAKQSARLLINGIEASTCSAIKP